MKDERLDKMNQEYHEIFIPAELRQRVETGIREAKKDMETERQTTIERKKKPMKKKNNKMITFAPNKTPIQPYEDNCNHRTDRN